MPNPTIPLIQTAGNVATAAYGNTPPPGFSVWKNNIGEEIKQTYASGVQTTAYVNGAGQVWIGIAGTNDTKDVASWAGAYAGWSVGAAQYKDIIDFGGRVKATLVAEGISDSNVYIAGHSWGNLLGQVMSTVYGWYGVGFDGPGAQAVVTAPGFSAYLTDQGITAIGSSGYTDVQSSGVAIFGGGVVGLTGLNIPNTTVAYVEGDFSISSAIVHGIFTFAGGPLGFILGKLFTGYTNHSMAGVINPAIQAGKITIPAPGSPAPQAEQPQVFSFTDDDGNTLSTINDANGKPQLDAAGKPLLQLQMNNGVTTIHDGDGRIISTSEPTAQNAAGSTTNDLTTTVTPTTGQAQQEGATDFGNQAAGVSQGVVASGVGWSITINGDILNADQLVAGQKDNTAAAAKTQIVSDSERPGNHNLATEVISEFSLTYWASNTPSQFQGAALNTGDALAQVVAPTDPLVLDLNGDGVHLTDFASNPVLFDTDHDGGSLEQTGWVSSQDGIVVQDLNNNGQIDGIHETLSEYFNGAVGTGGNAGTKPYANGLAALKSLDSNNDNVFNNLDASWNNLRVWVDANHDGKTDSGELKTFGQLNITSINLNSTTQSGLVRDGNEVLASSTFVINGVTREALAANFLANPNGHTFTTSGAGQIVATQGGNGTSATSAYVSQSTVGETINVAVKGVVNAYGGTGADNLIGDANNNWLAGGPGSDSFNAGAGDDVLLIDADGLSANIHAGAGTDIVQVIGDAGVPLNLTQAEVEVAQSNEAPQ